MSPVLSSPSPVWSSLELSTVIAKDRHADRATRLKKALDDEASRRQD